MHVQVGAGYGALAWAAAAVGRWSPELGFQSWTIFDLPHVSALQASF